MKTGMTSKETRDPHAHARIDAMQMVLAQMLSDLAVNGSARNVDAMLLCFKQVDDAVDEAFRLHAVAGTDRSEE